jgi:hypothetical protein
MTGSIILVEEEETRLFHLFFGQGSSSANTVHAENLGALFS